MRIYRSVLEPKYFTVKEWNKFNKLTEDYVIIDGEKNYLTMQEILLAKYQVILKDYKVNPMLAYKDLTKKELIVKVGKTLNMTNFNKGMKIFNQGVKGFTDSIDAVTSQLGPSTKNGINHKKNNVKIWGDKKSAKKIHHAKIWSDKKPSRKSHVKIWGDPPAKKKRKHRHKPVQNRDKQNLSRIWGRK